MSDRKFEFEMFFEEVGERKNKLLWEKNSTEVEPAFNLELKTLSGKNPTSSLSS